MPTKEAHNLVLGQYILFRMKKNKLNILPIAGILAILTSCSTEQIERVLDPLIEAPASTIERNVKGHEQIYAVQVILRLAQKRADGHAYVAYGLSNFVEPPIPVYQQIDISKDDFGRITIVSARKHFDVVKSNKYYYALELKYYDLNGKLINHQFSTYDAADLEGSTLLHHQHFFTLQNYSLYGQQLVYPMTLDSLYYDDFTFQKDGRNKRIESSEISPNNVYVPIEGSVENGVRYNERLAQKAIENSTTKAATKVYTDPSTGMQYKMYKTLLPTKLDDKVKQIFTYTYRDTDPVEDELFSKVKGLDDLGRQRVGKNVQLLQQNRDLTTEARRDYLGFKGILQFKKSNISFQMRVCIAHMITSTEKYIGPSNVRGVMHEHNEISPAWNSYDIDYPIAFRVIADTESDSRTFVKDVQRFYPGASEDKLLKMFANDSDWFSHFSKTTM